MKDNLRNQFAFSTKSIWWVFFLLSWHLNAIMSRYPHYLNVKTVPDCSLRIFPDITEDLSTSVKRCFGSGTSLCVLNYGVKGLSDNVPHLFQCFLGCSFQEP